ncbi:MAG: Na+/H+ antiporter NhaA [Bacteroidetes bacterium]|nr:Na+/H+ antiporter NhaA [Bacteroidota bacterium]
MDRPVITNTKSLRHHILTPLRDLLNDSRATGVLLICCTVVSIFFANLFSNGWYLKLWNNTIPGTSVLHLPGNLLEWINNFLMAFFFVLAATEIKRELLTGELSTFKKAILPFGAAFGGMLVPALIFTAFNFHSNYSHGWGIPTATDIAFSIGAASLLGKRFPVGLKILLMALAIIDDLGAIIVIAVFYGGHIQWLYLGGCGLVYGLLLALNYFKARFGAIQILLGITMWYLMLQSGVEASITGVLFAFAMPVDSLAIIEKAIHKYVNFLILPLFALANTAILISSNIMTSLSTTISLGIICGLVIGKPLGIFLVSRIMVALNIAHLPGNIKWKQVFGMGTLAGIGFTMSIFTTMLAFTSSEARDIAKIAILTSVVASVVLSFIYFRVIGTATIPSPSVAIPEKEPEIQLIIS